MTRDTKKWAMDNKLFFFAAAVLLACGQPAAAQQTKKVFRVGYIAAAEGASPFYDGFRQGLRDRGYVEGHSITIEYRSSENRDRLAEFAREMVALNLDVIVTQGAAVRAVQAATSVTPVVFGFSGDPVEAGFVNGLAHPGRNMTGMTFLALELAGKRLELLKEVVPKMSRVTIVANRSHPGEQNEYSATAAAAQALKTKLQHVSVNNSADFEKAFDAIVKDGTDALITFPDGITLIHRDRLAKFALKTRLPTMFGWKEYVEAGGLVSYGPNLSDSFRRLTGYVDKILKGAKPGDLPVEQPTKFELVINLKTAKQIGLTIPPNVLARADKVIK
jgi:ABC-type uncharacterized transport system substrate-binding protein